MKDLINIKNNVNKCFLWCHIRHLNPLKTRLGKITKLDKKKINDFDYETTKFPISEKTIAKLKRKIIFASMYFVVKMI